ncbi:MAG: 6-bladed beta-propeller [Gemmatimonadaceae bacterium]
MWRADDLDEVAPVADPSSLSGAVSTANHNITADVRHSCPVVCSERRYLLLCTLVWLAACTPTENQQGSVQSVDSSGVALTTIMTSSSSVPQWTLSRAPVLKLSGTETGDSLAFANVGHVRFLSNGGIVVGDNAANRLLLFDSTGAYLRSLGRQGDGPGEVRFVTSLNVLPGDSLTTFDGRLRRLTIWHPQRGFVRAIPVGGSSDESWPDDAWLWRDSLVILRQHTITPLGAIPAGAGVRRWPTRGHLTLHDTTGRVLATSPEFEAMYSGPHETGDTRLPFSHRAFTAVARQRIYFGAGDRFSLSYLDANFAWAGEIRWPSQHEPLTAEEVAAVRSEAEALAVARMPLDRARARLANSFASQILPDERPSIGRVIVASDGTLWIERFEAVRLGAAIQKAGDRWSVLNSEGLPLGRVTLPANARLEAVRDTHALLVERDTLDIQTVTVRVIVRP